MPKFFTKYNPLKVPGFSSEMESKVQEQFADACQTDSIIRKYNMMGVNPFISSGHGEYLDTTLIPSFLAAKNSEARVREFFEGLPSDVRLEFNNDPIQFAEVVSDPSQADYLREIGVLPPLPVKQDGDKQPSTGGDNSDISPDVSQGGDLFNGDGSKNDGNPDKSMA